ncbi:MAG: hypothetical protein ABIQ60_08140, partial [Burkholderiaceae bacterium]
ACALGLPQGLLHLQYRERLPVSALLGWTRRFLARLALVMLVVALCLLWLAPPFHVVSNAQAATLALIVPFGVAHLLWRAFVLKTRGVFAYGAVTSLPALLTLVGIAGLCLVGPPHGFEWILLGSAALAATVGAVLMRARSRSAGNSTARVPARMLWSVSAQTWIQGLMAALMPALLLSLSAWSGATLADIGVVSLGLQVYQLFAVLGAYAAPMIYDKAARVAERDTATRDLDALLARVPALAWLGLAALAVAGPWLATRAVVSMAAFVVPLTVLTVAGVVSLLVRLLWTLAQARGEIRELSVQAVWRLALACAMTAALVPRVGAAVAIPWVLLVVESLTLARLAIADKTSRRAFREPQ